MAAHIYQDIFSAKAIVDSKLSSLPILKLTLKLTRAPFHSDCLISIAYDLDCLQSLLPTI